MWDFGIRGLLTVRAIKMTFTVLLGVYEQTWNELCASFATATALNCVVTIFEQIYPPKRSIRRLHPSGLRPPDRAE
jgi:hypothetical protein